MSVKMDRALMALSLEDEEVPLSMPDLPDFKSCETNRLSIMGRALNPDCQKMSALIMKMPRKWQKEGRIRGVALSKEKFQFIFRSEHDLVEVLEKGVQTFNEWVIVLDRWVEHPPVDFLQFIPMWVQISRIPMDYYTMKAITWLGDLVGEVKEVAFDPSKPMSHDFVRVKVLFNVAKPLRKEHVVHLPGGGSATIRYHYENIQKRCFSCQRLNHEKSACPLLLMNHREKESERKLQAAYLKTASPVILKVDDPLYGVLQESQVGINPLTGQPRIAKEVLDEMRRYLLVDNGDASVVKMERVRASVKEVENDPLAHRSMLRMEALPVITYDLNKGKGHIFDYEQAPGFQSGEVVSVGIMS